MGEVHRAWANRALIAAQSRPCKRVFSACGGFFLYPAGKRRHVKHQQEFEETGPNVRGLPILGSCLTSGNLGHGTLTPCAGLEGWGDPKPKNWGQNPKIGQELTHENPGLLGPRFFSPELLGGTQEFSLPVFFSDQAGAFMTEPVRSGSSKRPIFSQKQPRYKNQSTTLRL